MLPLSWNSECYFIFSLGISGEKALCGISIARYRYGMAALRLSYQMIWNVL